MTTNNNLFVFISFISIIKSSTIYIWFTCADLRGRSFPPKTKENNNSTRVYSSFLLSHKYASFFYYIMLISDWITFIWNNISKHFIRLKWNILRINLVSLMGKRKRRRRRLRQRRGTTWHKTSYDVHCIQKLFTVYYNTPFCTFTVTSTTCIKDFLFFFLFICLR